MTIATEIAAKWGPSFTKAVNDGDLSAFKDLFVKDAPVEVVLQNSAGTESEFTIGGGSEDDASLTWEEFHEAATKDLKDQNYAKTETQVLGVLGNRMIMEIGRFNKDGEVYAEAYSLLTFNNAGKILAVESFTDPQAPSLLAAAAGKGADS
jgi:ketosteroid isomerase-like protein